MKSSKYIGLSTPSISRRSLRSSHSTFRANNVSKAFFEFCTHIVISCKGSVSSYCS